MEKEPGKKKKMHQESECELDERAEDLKAENSEAPEEIIADVPELAAALDLAQKQAAENLDRYQRTLAEFDNFRKRTIKEKASMYDDGACDIISGLLPIVDNFERAFASCSESDKETAFHKGSALIYKQLITFMESKGITAIEAKGKTFDPEIHSAVAHVDDPEHGDGEIIEDMCKGYKFKDKVLRHSMVKVAN